MRIELYKVTWYSKLFAVFVFLIVMAIGFYFGMAYQAKIDVERAEVAQELQAMNNGIKIRETETSTEIEEVASQLPITCVDELEGIPVITYISSRFGSSKANIELRGCNFAGFEGDKTAYIENKDGVKGVLYGGPGSTDKILKISLKPSLCQKDNSYSGLPCDSWLTLSPGTYQIYTMPWGKKSNVVQFVVK